jgi:hypothetical protein
MQRSLLSRMRFQRFGGLFCLHHHDDYISPDETVSEISDINNMFTRLIQRENSMRSVAVEASNVTEHV